MFVLNFGLLLADIGLYIFDKVGGYTLVSWVSRRHGRGLSLVNMGRPEMFYSSSSKAIVAAAARVLSTTCASEVFPRDGGGDGGRGKMPSLGGTRTVNLDLDVAKTLLILSALVYERKDALVSEAAIFPRWTEERLFASEQTVHAIAAGLGLRFCAVSDFTSVSGSYAGAFWPARGPPFIVLSFKGTTPSNFGEFLVDTSINHVDARSMLFGACHQGFYSALFPSQASGSHINPHRRITQIVRRIAEEILDRLPAGQDKIPLWISGHSLGGGLATLLYARTLFEQSDLGEHVELRDGFVYGCPRVGDAEFCATFERLLEHEGNAQRSLWRIVDEADIVARVPPGMADQEDQRMYLTPTNLLNYGFIGTGVHLDHNAPLMYSLDCRGIRVGDAVMISESGVAKEGRVYPTQDGAFDRDDTDDSGSGGLDMPSKNTPNLIAIASFVMKVFCPWLRDHFPARYWEGLARINGLMDRSSAQLTQTPVELDNPRSDRFKGGAYRLGGETRKRRAPGAGGNGNGRRVAADGVDGAYDDADGDTEVEADRAARGGARGGSLQVPAVVATASAAIDGTDDAVVFDRF